MKLQTKVEIKPFEQKIGYESRLFTIGSCFADRVGQQMSRAKLRVDVNPMGVVFNPISVCNTIERIAECRKVTAEEMTQGVGAEPAWYHFDFHSSLTTSNREQSVEQINQTIERAHQALTHSDWVVITLGTAWVYESLQSGAVVANCHKRPQREFSRRRLTVDEVVEALDKVVNGALADKHIILTVSPIRHIGDGLIENSVSKATLRLAIEALCERHQNVEYFPAYEIVIDELRDYRFYEQDMVHIAPIAVEYIWERFIETALSERAIELLPHVMQVVRASEHRAINPASESHKKFIANQLLSIEKLPEVDFSEEIAKFEDILKINL